MSKIYWDTNKCIDLCKSVGVQFLSREYLNNRTKYKYRCKCGNIFERRWDTFVNRKSFYCSNCSLGKRHNSIMLKRKEEIEKEGCKLLTKRYCKNTEPMKIKCRCSRVHNVSWSVILNRKSAKCRVCLGHTIDDAYIKKDMEKHGIKLIKRCSFNHSSAARDIYLYRCKCGNIYSKSYESQLRRGYGCPDCVDGYMTWTLETARVYCEEIGSKFLSSNFDKMTDEYKFECSKCGNIFSRTFQNLLRYSSLCRECTSKSKGEDKIREILELKNIDYIEEKSFKYCVGSKGWKLRYDFFIPKMNTLIEYNGKQHYKAIDFFGGEDTLNIQKENDKIKKEFAKINNINLVVISYWDYDKIYNTINKLLKAS